MIAVDVCPGVTECYENGRWVDLGKFAKLPLEITDQQLIVANNELYHAGGEFFDTTIEQTSFLDCFYRYKRLKNEWIALSPMFTRRRRFAMVDLNDHIYMP